MLASSGAWFTSRLAAASDPCDPANLNPIVCENSNPGDPVSEWGVGGAGDPSIQGFATDISVNRGQTISFKVKTAANAYRIDMYRLGYYGGLGARRIATVTPSVSLPQSQPACLTDSTTGLIDCGNWAVSATWAVPATAVSGIYVGRLVRTDTGGASHIVFIVRDDAGRSDILFQTADTTWQAYNQYGGNSLYVGSPAGRAYKVSYNRPFATRGTSPEDWLFNAEYPMVRWLEANGYDVSYSTGLDTDRRGAELVEHKILLSVGHDEYWSGGQRANVEAAREAGVHLAFFSGNEIFWKTRWENSIAGPTTAHRTLVAYKETHAGAKIDPDPQWTGTWRDPRFSPPADGGRPENALSGTLFMINDPCDQAIQVPAADGRMRFWRGTGVAALAPGQTATLSQSTLGYECDEDVDNGVRPQGLIRLSTTIFDAPSRLLDYGSTFGPGTANHALTLYKAPSGALVFGAGTVQWSWGLDGNHDRGGSPPDLTMQQATVNLFADMGVQPWTLDPALVAASPSSDAVSPTSVISSPENGASVPAGTDVTIAGTATDVGGGVVGGVEVSGDGGASWHPANGRENWTYVWTTPASGSVTIMSRAVDDSGNLQTAATSVTVNVGGGGGGSCPCSLWSVSTVPGGYQAGHDGAVELGVKFQATSAGAITGIRFYKGTTYSGPHTGSLWTNTGTLLATATFSSESASGWQQVDFATPVQIQANVTHVASYHKSSGGYYFDGAYFGASGVNRPPLRAPASGAAGGNGVYLYGPGGFPTNSYNATNYWVDVVFVPSSPTDSMPPTVTSVMPAAGSKAPTSTTVMTTFSEAMSPASINGGTFELRDSANALVNSSVTYDGTTRTAVLTPTSALSPAASYVATVKGGTGGVKDVAGNPLASDYTWSFSTSGGRPDPKSGPGGPILLVTNAGDPFGYYYAEILRTEGLNEFAVADVSELSPGMLSSFDVVLLAQTALSPAQAATLRDWVNGGGNLVAMRPDAELATLLGLTPTTATMTDGYLLINTASTAGAGLVNETIQFHGTADRYGLAGATKVATLYTAAGAATSNPAVSLVAAGAGQAAAFTYDLARSVAYSRQGNPAWAGQERDGSNPIRPNDLFWGGGNPDWIDLGKVAIPQADEQQRLLANLIITMNAARKPLPRFWYFPFGKPAVVLMTGDDHANGGTPGRFDRYLSLSPPGCSVTNWECVRSTAYIYPHTPMTDSQVASYEAQGFDVGVHVDTGCADWTPSTLEAFYAAQIGTFQSNFPSARPPAAGRTHCIVWSDWASQPKVQLAYGTRLDVNYYYWPPSWASTRPGFFTHSGMPMRFVDLDGSMIDVYQAATQLTDESGQVYPATLDTLLDRAMGATGYYGVFTANIHSDAPLSSDADAIVQSALTRGIPVVSAAQLLQWLDGRHGSSFESLSWSSGTLTFTISPGAGAVGLQAMLPTEAGALTFSGLTNGGAAVPFQTTTVKGIGYAVFAASAGSYTATYSGAPPPPLPALSIDDITVTESATGSVSGLFTARLSESSTKTITVSYATADGSASAPADYLAKSGSLTFSPGATSATVAVTVNADGLVEPAENFFVNLTSPSNATLAKSQGTATILDAPSIAAPSGLGATAVSSTRVNLTWTDNATNETGYRVERRLLPGGVYGVIATLGTNATTFSDTGVGASSSYSYRVQASAGTMRSPYSNEASVTTPPGGLPSIAINDVTVSEPSTGTVNAIFNVTLSGPAPSTVSVNFVTANGSASAGNDYELNAGTLSFAPGVTSKAIPVLVKADAVTEPNETYFVNLSGATNATLAKNQGVGTIINGGPPPPTGSGLTGEYFASADLTNRKFTRVDPIVDFDWGKKSPDPSLPADGFSIRWSGELVPRFSETYTFYATTDDGVRLWVDGVLLINDWTKRGKKELKKTMALSSGKPYSIVMEFANFEGNAIAKLSWSSRSESKKIIPQSQLFP